AHRILDQNFKETAVDATRQPFLNSVRIAETLETLKPVVPQRHKCESDDDEDEQDTVPRFHPIGENNNSNNECSDQEIGASSRHQNPEKSCRHTAQRQNTEQAGLRRSEERRVGKEGRSREWRDEEKKRDIRHT